jgi:UDP-glucose 4-epimerase
MSFKNKTVLVTGGCGFIGSHIVDRALQLGAKNVFAIDNLVSGSIGNISHLRNEKRFEFIKGDVRNYKKIFPYIKKSDYIFHEAASKLVVSLKKPRIDLETNIIGMFNILEAARLSNKYVRIIYASTGSVLGSCNKPMKENHKKNPTTLYGISKGAAENYCLHYCREFKIPVSVLRYFHVYGPRQDYKGEAGVVSIFLSRVLKDFPPIIFGTGDQVRCFTYVEDVVNATFLLAKKRETIGEIYNVASKARIKVKELALTVTEKYGHKYLKPEFGPARLGENMRPVPDTKKIEKLGFKAKTNFEEGLEKTKVWVKRQIGQND